MGSHGTFSKIVSSHGMQWDISKIFRPMGWDTFQKLFIPWDGILFKNFSSHGMGYISKFSIHPIRWDVILLKNVPWDGMGLSHPTRSPDHHTMETIIEFRGINIFYLKKCRVGSGHQKVT